MKYWMPFLLASVFMITANFEEGPCGNDCSIEPPTSVCPRGYESRPSYAWDEIYNDWAFDGWTCQSTTGGDSHGTGAGATTPPQ